MTHLPFDWFPFLLCCRLARPCMLSSCAAHRQFKCSSGSAHAQLMLSSCSAYAQLALSSCSCSAHVMTMSFRSHGTKRPTHSKPCSIQQLRVVSCDWYFGLCHQQSELLSEVGRFPSKHLRKNTIQRRCRNVERFWPLQRLL